MQKIHKLSHDIIAKIAAGEVVERPAYAVKELIENSIDAKATSIIIHIENSGLRKIKVMDNGEGMSKEDLQISFLPHTTSKIKYEEELIGIQTLGFRGEALSSICSVSNLTIQSRTKKSASGTTIEIEKGRVEHIGSVGIPSGTIITVDELFSPVPARKKFLKERCGCFLPERTFGIKESHLLSWQEKAYGRCLGQPQALHRWRPAPRRWPWPTHLSVRQWFRCRWG